MNMIIKSLYSSLIFLRYLNIKNGMNKKYKRFEQLVDLFGSNPSLFDYKINHKKELTKRNIGICIIQKEIKNVGSKNQISKKEIKNLIKHKIRTKKKLRILTKLALMGRYKISFRETNHIRSEYRISKKCDLIIEAVINLIGVYEKKSKESIVDLLHFKSFEYNKDNIFLINQFTHNLDGYILYYISSLESFPLLNKDNINEQKDLLKKLGKLEKNFEY